MVLPAVSPVTISLSVGVVSPGWCEIEMTVVAGIVSAIVSVVLNWSLPLIIALPVDDIAVDGERIDKVQVAQIVNMAVHRGVVAAKAAFAAILTACALPEPIVAVSASHSDALLRRCVAAVGILRPGSACQRPFDERFAVPVGGAVGIERGVNVRQRGVQREAMTLLAQG